MADIADQFAPLAGMTLAQLRCEWERVIKSSAPASFGSDLLARGIAYRLQEVRHGRLPKNIAREIERRAKLAEQGRVGEPTIRLKPGTRLSREWQGRTHHVLVEDQGYHYADRRYASLTAIARDITGTAWSGPRFFGLRSPRLRKAREASQ